MSDKYHICGGVPIKIDDLTDVELIAIIRQIHSKDLLTIHKPLFDEAVRRHLITLGGD